MSLGESRSDPFAPLTRARRLGAARDRLVRALRRPFRGTRCDPHRDGPPNLLIMAVDTLRADHVGRAAPGGSLTPALDRLAAEGTAFADVHAPAPWTLPSFASALTGVMPTVHGAGMTGAVRNMAHEVPRTLAGGATLARHLAGMGYRTAAFHSNPFVTFGLAESFGEHVYRNHACEDVAAGALDWIRRHGDRPFFCFVLFNDPHEPTLPRPGDFGPLLAETRRAWNDEELRSLARWGGSGSAPHLGRTTPPLDDVARDALAAKLALYGGAVARVDAAVDAVDAQLHAWGLADRTLLTVFSDHGEEFLEHQEQARAWDHDPRDLRAIGHGHTLFQELLHVPWLVRGPGLAEEATRPEPVSLCDVGPTLAAWLGVDGLPLPTTDLPELLGRPLPREAEDHDAEPGAERVLLAEDIAYGPDLVAVRRGRWKLVATRDAAPLALYDLDDDPAETRDRRDDEPDALADLVAIATRWRDAAAADDRDGDGWETTDQKVLRQLRELGYAE